MQRLLDSLQITAYLVGITAVIYVSVHAVTVLTKLGQELDQGRITHQQMLKDHQQQLKDHERQMERLERR